MKKKMKFKKISYDIPEGLYYFTFKEKEEVCETVVTENSLIHLDENNDWIGFDISLNEKDIKESYPKFSDQKIIEILNEINKNNPYCWKEGKIKKSLKQELILDFDEFGLMGAEVILIPENRRIGMKFIISLGINNSR